MPTLLNSLSLSLSLLYTHTYTHAHARIQRHEYVTALPPPQAVLRASTESPITRRRQRQTPGQIRVLPIPRPIRKVRVHVARASQGWFDVGCTHARWAKAYTKRKSKDQVQVRGQKKKTRSRACLPGFQTCCIDYVLHWGCVCDEGVQCAVKWNEGKLGVRRV
jgi:hypothetical protein